MPASILASPYDDQEIEETYLGNAPLVRVLAQVRHPTLAVLVGSEGKSAALRVAERLSKDYPIFNTVKDAQLVVLPKGIERVREDSTTWRISSSDENWQVSLNQGFISFETSKYEGRSDFCRRLSRVLTAYSQEIEPPTASRTGIRYTNRIDDPGIIANLPDLVRPELLGPAASNLPNGVQLRHSFSQAQYLNGEGGGLLVNWGLLPPDSGIDATISPVPRPTWILDVDSFEANKRSFDAQVLSEMVRDLASRAYQCFRWAVTDEFIDTFRGSA